MKYTILFLIFLGAAFGCTRKNNRITHDAVVNIHFDLDNPGAIESDYFLDSIRYVKLETDTNCFLSRIKKIICFNRKYYILNGTNDVIFVFSCDGRYLSKLDRQGVGPEEYILINDFTIDKYDSTLTITDPSQEKELVYSANSLDFVKQRKLADSFRFFSAVSAGKYLLYGLKNEILLVDESSVKTKLVAPAKVELPNFPVDDIGYVYELDKGINGIFLPTTNTVYHYSDDKMQAKYQISYSKTTPADVYAGEEADYQVFVRMHKENSRWIFQLLINKSGKGGYFVLYDKINRKSFTINKFTNLFDPIFTPDFPDLVKNCIVQANFLPASELKELLMNHPDSGVSDHLKAVIRESEDEDNPVLQIIYMKSI